jgi:hypothetical protein
MIILPENIPAIPELRWDLAVGNVRKEGKSWQSLNDRDVRLFSDGKISPKQLYVLRILINPNQVKIFIQDVLGERIGNTVCWL